MRGVASPHSPFPAPALPKETPMPSILVVEQDEIEAYADLAKDVLHNIFGLDSNKALLTDATALSDFFPAGLALSREDIDQAPYAALLERWDRQVVERVRQRYALDEVHAQMRLLELLRAIREHTSPTGTAPTLH